MDWLLTLFTDTSSVAHAILIIALVSVLGLAIGNFKIGNISLGIAGVLFSGLLFGHFGLTLEPEVIHFLKDFGLILFVYSIGMQVGPSFIESFRDKGLTLNMLAFMIVGLGVLTTIGIIYLGHIQTPIAVGLFSGATTNTPSLAAAQLTLKDMFANAPEVAKMPGLGYAVAYPFGIIGIILTMTLVRLGFGIKAKEEAKSFLEEQKSNTPALERWNLKVTNPNVHGKPISELPYYTESSVIISRVLHCGILSVPTVDTLLYDDDIILAVGTPESLEPFRVLIGEKSDIDLMAHPGEVHTRRIIVTKRSFNGKTVDELSRLYNLAITRVHRTEIEIIPSPDFRVQFGDRLRVVGAESDIERISKALGNSLELLNHPQMISIFVGIALGVILGSWPFYIPGMSAPVKLGLAGGPLLVALVLSRVGYMGKINWYMPSAANIIIREIGIILFLVCVGLDSGGEIMNTLMNGQGFYWMGCAALITFIPLAIVGFISRFFFKLNYMSICGLLSGSMTDPPALAFANSIATSNAPSIAYASVYPLVMLLRVVSAQALVLFFAR